MGRISCVVGRLTGGWGLTVAYFCPKCKSEPTGRRSVILLGDLDSNQEWRIQSPLFCQLNYLPMPGQKPITRPVA